MLETPKEDLEERQLPLAAHRHAGMETHESVSKVMAME
jgi:hypothetical protein